MQVGFKHNKIKFIYFYLYATPILAHERIAKGKHGAFREDRRI